MERKTLIFITALAITIVLMISLDKKTIERFTDPEYEISLKDTIVYLINLDRNPERLDSFIEQYMMSDLRYKQFTRVPAVDGKQIQNIQDLVTIKAYQEIEQIEKTGYRTKHYQLTRGAIGCYMSHMKVLEEIANAAELYGMIFEDDVIIQSDIFKRFNRLLSGIPNDWDILLLGCHPILCDKYSTFYDCNRFFLLHNYCVKKKSAQKLHTYLKSIKIKQQIDSEMSDMASSGNLKIYCLRESLSKQSGATATTIQTPIHVIDGLDPFLPV